MATSSDEIYQLIACHNAFFGKIIDMIPRDLYRAKEETEESISSQKYYKHRKQPLAPDEKKEIRKRKLSEKYASNAENSTASVGDDNDADNEPAVESSSQANVEQEAEASSSPEEDVNYKSLREKLQERIKSLQNDRVSQKEHKKPKQAKAVLTKAERKAANKLKASNGQTKPAAAVQDKSREVMSALLKSSSASTATATAAMAVPKKAVVQEKDKERDYSEQMDVEYGMIKGVNTSSSGDSSMANAKSGGKINRLKRMLEEADKKHKRLAELKSTAINQVIKDGSGDGSVASGSNVALNKLRAEQWSDALKDAAGTSAMTDTDKLKKAIKRIEKKKAKSSEQWHDRKATEEGILAKKIASREKNIAGRHNGGVVPAAAEEGEGGANGSGGAATKRPRLFMAMKQKEDEKKFGPDQGDGNSKTGGSGKPAAAAKNRAGFEGKKSDMLNKPRKK